MATVSQFSCYKRSKQWWRSPNTDNSRKILLLLLWYTLFLFSWTSIYGVEANGNVQTLSILVSYIPAPFLGWLADVKFGRYNILISSTFISFCASIFLYLVPITEGASTSMSNVFLYAATITVYFGKSCYLAAMLPFLTDQLIGATSDQLSSVVRWYY